MKEGNAKGNRFYRLITVLMTIIILILLAQRQGLSQSLESYKKHYSDNAEMNDVQMKMLEYISGHREEIVSYGQLLLDGGGTVYENGMEFLDSDKMTEYGLEYFADVENTAWLKKWDDHTVEFIYMNRYNEEYDEYLVCSFFYITEATEENSRYVKDSVCVGDNIYFMPAYIWVVPRCGNAMG
ncbi:MAG: hypothetical protein K2N72_08500 [Oscillospiraceae bacterium]|nr:hypothetical protein [Oscillospiraceae bacterium]